MRLINLKNKKEVKITVADLTHDFSGHIQIRGSLSRQDLKCLGKSLMLPFKMTTEHDGVFFGQLINVEEKFNVPQNAKFQITFKTLNGLDVFKVLGSPVDDIPTFAEKLRAKLLGVKGPCQLKPEHWAAADEMDRIIRNEVEAYFDQYTKINKLLR